MGHFRIKIRDGYVPLPPAFATRNEGELRDKEVPFYIEGVNSRRNERCLDFARLRANGGGRGPGPMLTDAAIEAVIGTVPAPVRRAILHDAQATRAEAASYRECGPA